MTESLSMIHPRTDSRESFSSQETLTHVLCKKTTTLKFKYASGSQSEIMPILKEGQYVITLEEGGAGVAVSPDMCRFPEELDLLMCGRR